MHLKFNKRRPRQNARRRLLHFEQCEGRLLLSVSPSGDAASERELLAGDVIGKPAIQVRIETTNVAGEPISEAGVGAEFVVNVYVQDVRAAATGVFATYLDLLYDPDLVVAGNVVQFGSGFPHGQTIDASIPGVIDEVGGFSTSQQSGSTEQLLMSMPFVATQSGRVDFVGEQPDYLGSIPLLYGHNFGVPFDEVDFGKTTLRVVARDLPALESFSTELNATSNNTTSAFQIVDSFRNERRDIADRLSESYVEKYFASAHATSPWATNGGFYDLNRLQLAGGLDIDVSVIDAPDPEVSRSAQIATWLSIEPADDRIPITFEFDANLGGVETELGYASDVHSLSNDVSGQRVVRITPQRAVRRVAEDYISAGDKIWYSHGLGDVGSSNKIRPFSSADLPDMIDTSSLASLTSESDTDLLQANPRSSALRHQVPEASLSDSTRTLPDDAVREHETPGIALNALTRNGGYIDLADLRQVALPKPIGVPKVSMIKIARTDNRPTSGQAPTTSTGASEDALSSLTWQLKVDGSRGVSLSFEIGQESQAARTTRANETRGDDPRPRDEGGRSMLRAPDASELDTPVILTDAKTASLHIRDGAEKVDDERRHYLAVSPLIVMVAGTLLVTDHWQKCQHREVKRQTRPQTGSIGRGRSNVPN